MSREVNVYQPPKVQSEAPTPDQRGDVNMLWWRHHGHEYAVVGTANLDAL